MSYNVNYYDIVTNPIFVKDGVEYPFEGLSKEEEGARRGSNMEFRYIANTLRYYFGDDVDFDEGSVKGTIKLAFLTNEQMIQLSRINEYTNEFPVKHEQSYLKFKIGSHVYDKPPCDDNCDCCACLGCCGYKE
jgi:hypothetical protein